MNSTLAPAKPVKFSVPVTRANPRNSHVYYVWSPKLRRGLSLFSRLEVDAWVHVEATPEIHTFCEYPCAFQLNAKQTYPSFWVSKDTGDEFWFVKWSDDLQKFREALEASNCLKTWVTTRGINTRLYDESEIRQNPKKLRNWSEIIHVLSISGQYITDNLRDEVLQFIKRNAGVPIEQIIALYTAADEDIALAAIYQLIQQGKIHCAGLDELPINRKMQVFTL